MENPAMHPDFSEQENLRGFGIFESVQICSYGNCARFTRSAHSDIPGEYPLILPHFISCVSNRKVQAGADAWCEDACIERAPEVNGWVLRRRPVVSGGVKAHFFGHSIRYRSYTFEPAKPVLAVRNSSAHRSRSSGRRKADGISIMPWRPFIHRMISPGIGSTPASGK